MVKKTSKIYTILLLLFLYVPITLVVIMSFNKVNSSYTWHGFSFKWYGEIGSNIARFYNYNGNGLRDLMDYDLFGALFVTLTIAIIATVCATILGTISAIGIYNLKNRSRRIVLGFNNLPILNPEIVTGISLMVLFLALRFRFGYTTMLLAHIIFDTPYVILAIFPRIKQLDPNVFEAALDLGATPFQAIRKIILPQLAPGIITGSLIAFTMSIDDFVISYFTTANGVNNLSIWIYNQTSKRVVSQAAYAISTIMLVIVITLLTIIFLRLAKEFKKKETVD